MWPRVGAVPALLEWSGIMNPKLGLYEVQALQQMSDDDFELYLDNAVVLYAQSRCFADPDVAAAFANEFNSKSGQ
jgi:hypothetical protein